MIYIIYGPLEPLVKTRIQEIINQSNLDLSGFNLTTYNALETSIEDIIQDAMTLPFGSPQKIIHVRHAFFFLGEKPKGLSFDFDEVNLLNYLNNPTPTTILIFECIGSKLMIPANLLKPLKKKATIEEIADLDKDGLLLELGKLLQNEKMTMDVNAISILLDRCQNDLSKITQEVQKLALYAPHITVLDVENLVSRPLEDKTYFLANAIMEKNIAEALSLFRDFKLQQIEPIQLIGMLAKQIHTLYQALSLSEQGIQQKEIATILKVHPYRIKMLIKGAGLSKARDYLRLLYEMAELDMAIKTGQQEKFLGFELFILNRMNPKKTV